MATRVYRARLLCNKGLSHPPKEAVKIELAWHTQKNQMSDVKGKEMEQERKGRIKNVDIDLDRTHLNFDFVDSPKTLYMRVKERVEFAKETGSRVQKNSVVMYSNILTVPQAQFSEWGDEKTKAYFKACYEFFSNEFGKENVVSAKVHLDETTPHMHLHFVPFNKETGKLQARISMNREKVNRIHDDLPKFLREHGFEVVRGSGKTEQNIEDIHEYKKIQKVIQEKKQELENVQLQAEKIIQSIPDKNELAVPLLEKEIQTEVVPKIFGKPEIKKVETDNYVITPLQYKMVEEMLIGSETLKRQNEYLVKENSALKSGEAYRSLEKRLNHYVHENVEQMKKIDTLQQENDKLKNHNGKLLERVKGLQLEINLLYLATRDFLKKHTKTPETYKNVFKGILGTVKDRLKELLPQNESKGFKSFLNDVHEADPDFVRTQQKKMPEKDSGIER